MKYLLKIITLLLFVGVFISCNDEEVAPETIKEAEEEQVILDLLVGHWYMTSIEFDNAFYSQCDDDLNLINGNILSLDFDFKENLDIEILNICDNHVFADTYFVEDSIITVMSGNKLFELEILELSEYTLTLEVEYDRRSDGVLGVIYSLTR